ncbi:hypothetical protein VTH82DRAFT_4679 [Thermothelomyces myriococcoides]
MGMAKCENTSNDLYVCINNQESSCDERINVLYFPGTPSVITTIGVAASTTSSSSSTSSSATITSSTSQESSPTTSPGSNRVTETQTPPDDDNTSSSTTNIGAIIGGVIGGVVALILAGVGGWLFATKRARRAYALNGMNANGTGIPLPSPPHQKLPFIGTSSYYNAPGDSHTLSYYSSPTQQHAYGPYEMPEHPTVSELSSDRRSEMPTNN